MNKICVIGGGISGLAIAHLLSDRCKVTVFERESMPGGLIKCIKVDGHLYHTVGGHVFNSKRQDVLDWFWSFFDVENEFVKTNRNAVIAMPQNAIVRYPIENHLYMLDEKYSRSVISDLLSIRDTQAKKPENLEDLFRGRFGETLYNIYFKPYNEKIWKKDLKDIPTSWLDGKLPTPIVEEIIFNNIKHKSEEEMVHSSFYYAKNDGSQYIANKFAEDLDVRFDMDIRKIKFIESGRIIVDDEEFDKVVFCGNIKDLIEMIENLPEFSNYHAPIKNLDYHGTTSVLCEIENNPYSWVYMPDQKHQSHRIICTGNFSINNNANNKMTGTIEFTNEMSKNDILQNLKMIPFSPKYLAHQYTKYTYPIQDTKTREMIQSVKNILEHENLYLLGRFAEWEYFNMDAAIGAAIDLSKRIFN